VVSQASAKDDPEADAAFVPEPDVDTPPGKANGDPTLADDTPADPSADDYQSHDASWEVAGRGSHCSAVLFLATLGFYQKFHAGAVKQENVRLVVLPFVNLSGDPNQDYLSAGLTDVITTQLGRLDPQHIRVIAPTSARVMSGKPVGEIRQTLNVQYILEGSVQRVAIKSALMSV